MAGATSVNPGKRPKCNHLSRMMQKSTWATVGQISTGYRGYVTVCRNRNPETKRIKEAEGAQFQCEGGSSAFDHGDVDILGRRTG